MLVDTDILIDYLRGNPKAEAFVESNLDDMTISSITVGELYQGIKEGEERSALDSMISALNTVPVSEDIAKEGGLMCREYRKSHGIGLADCLLAATAKHHDLPLRTLNLKHYPMLENIASPYKKS
ncbi:MAG: type II toxin-antitoxin system VapC family toxin [Verrucomicrobia bacterium]|nr:type II toxin-antitoxin system VapC family toxin [Verrucomicrobiota bacterium]MDA1065064.1 type II toxin-antitoxin system VapC family toxin [Verrucomicrobiota bacterium]